MNEKVKALKRKNGMQVEVNKFTQLIKSRQKKFLIPSFRLNKTEKKEHSRKKIYKKR